MINVLEFDDEILNSNIFDFSSFWKSKIAVAITIGKG